MYKWDGLFATRSIERVIGHVCPQCRSGERGVRKIAKKKKKMLKGQKWLAYSLDAPLSEVR